MRNKLLAFVLSLAPALPCVATADELTIPGDAPAAITLPKKGETQTKVVKIFGEPQKKYAPVGGETQKHPPITRWDYANFSVFFEHSHVVDAVVPGQPATVYHTESLKPVSANF